MLDKKQGSTVKYTFLLQINRKLSEIRSGFYNSKGNREILQLFRN